MTFLCLRIALALAFLTAPVLSHAIEEPAYEVIRTIDDVELRQYAPYVVAEVRIEADAEEAGNLAFPILAGYIFGKNKGEKKFEMTAPVTQVATPKRLEMTAPVTQTAAPGAAGSYVIQFVLPKGVTLASAPEPLDPRVNLREVPASRIAVIRYSGFWSQANYAEHLDKLRSVLKTAGVDTTGEPVFSRYNPPLMPWFLRRNEIWLTVP
jgi:hypothetical protein